MVKRGIGESGPGVEGNFKMGGYFFFFFFSDMSGCVIRVYFRFFLVCVSVCACVLVCVCKCDWVYVCVCPCASIGISMCVYFIPVLFAFEYLSKHLCI